MKTFILICSLSLTLAAEAVCPQFNPPSKFTAKEELITVGTDVILMDGKIRVGEIEERTMRITPTFDLYNMDGKKVANARKKYFSWGTEIVVTDCEGKLLGTVKENIFRSLFGYYTRYDILNAKGAIIAATEKTEFFTTKFTVTASDGKQVMTLTRPQINILRDTWTIQISRKDVVDPRIMTMIPAFKTSADNKRREEEKEKK